MAASSLTILFMPESAYGPTNNCVGIGDVLRRRGHRVVFAAEASWRGRLAPLGFTEDLVDLAAPADAAGDAGEPGDAPDAGQFWKEFIARTAPEFRKLHHRAARHLDQAGLGRADRRRALLPRAAHRHHRQGPPGRDR